MYHNKGVDKLCRRTQDWGKGKKSRAVVHYTEEQLRSIFMRFDANHDGRLSWQELKNAFNSIGSRFPLGRAFLALHHADENGDGSISEDEMDELVKYAFRHSYTVT